MRPGRRLRDPHKPLSDPDKRTWCLRGDRGEETGARAASPACQRSGALRECTDALRPRCRSAKATSRAACGWGLRLPHHADCGSSGSGRLCSAGVCVGGVDAGVAGGRDGSAAQGSDGAGSAETPQAAIFIEGGGLACSAAGSSWTAAGMVLVALLNLASGRRNSRGG
jgi:hypothetical protein